MRILVVEDDPTNRLLLLRMLDHLGYRADSAADGLEALEATRHTRYDLILMDCHMPRLDGFAATAELRRREGAERRTPVVAITGSALERDRDHACEVAMDAYLLKPVSIATLAATVRAWIPELASHGGSAR